MDNWLSNFYALNPDAIVEEEVATKKVRTLVLANVLSALDFGDKEYYGKLSPEQKKEASMWQLMRFMSSSSNDAMHHLTFVNDAVNKNFSSLSKHPELQWKLLAMCGTKRKQFHSWIKPPKGAKKNKIESEVLKIYPLIKDADLNLLLQINTREELEEFFRENGYADKDIKELFKGAD